MILLCSVRKFLGKGLPNVALFSLFCLCACSQTPRQWTLTSNKGTHPHFRSSRLYLAPEDKFSGIELDILNTSQGRVAYLNAYGVELQDEGKSPEGYSIVNVTINIDQQSHIFTGFLLQGGHRILVPENATDLIIEALHANKSVEISVAHYSTTIIPDNFVKHYQKLTG